MNKTSQVTSSGANGSSRRRVRSRARAGHARIVAKSARDGARARERTRAAEAAVSARAGGLRRLVHQRSQGAAAAVELAAPGWEARRLVKPQFESVRGEARRGVVRDRAVHRRVLWEVAEAAVEWQARVAGVVDSGLPGLKGNREFFLHLVHSGRRRLPMRSKGGSTTRRAEGQTGGRDHARQARDERSGTRAAASAGEERGVELLLADDELEKHGLGSDDGDPTTADLAVVLGGDGRCSER